MVSNKPESPKKTVFGSKVAAYRKKAGLTQADLATLAGVNREYIGSMELGRVNVVYPEVFNKLRRVLGFPGWELLEAMGFRTDGDTTKGVIAPLQAVLGDLDEVQQRALLDLVMATLRFQTLINPEE